MKRDINIAMVIAAIVLTVTLSSPLSAGAQKYAIKPYCDLGLGSAMSLTTAFPGMTSRSSSNSFGVDFGYTIWQKSAGSLEVNVGIGYRATSVNFEVPAFSYDYAAPATADEDGNPYQRFSTLSDVEQKIDFGYLNIPIYLQYQYQVAKWLGIHAELGFDFGLKCSGKVCSTSGSIYSYGIYPEYNDLIINADYINDFGQRNLANADAGDAEINSFFASIMAGVGFEFYVVGPLSIDAGIRCNAGLSTIFTNKHSVNETSTVNSEITPVTYTVTHGQHVNALSDYAAKSHLNPLSLHVGVNVRF